MTGNHNFKFFVYIIESPAAADIYHGRGEGQVLQQAVNLNLTPCVHRVTVSRNAFVAAITIGLSEAMKAFPGLPPILHISAHGSEEGIQLTSGEEITWEELRALILPVNKAFNGGLFVCMSSCYGYAGIRMAMDVSEEEPPFIAIISNSQKPTWAETAVAFATFYHLIGNGCYVNDAVQAMKMASGNQFFCVETAAETKASYIKFLEQYVDTPQVAQEVATNPEAVTDALSKWAEHP